MNFLNVMDAVGKTAPVEMKSAEGNPEASLDALSEGDAFAALLSEARPEQGKSAGLSATLTRTDGMLSASRLTFRTMEAPTNSEGLETPALEQLVRLDPQTVETKALQPGTLAENALNTSALGTFGAPNTSNDAAIPSLTTPKLPTDPSVRRDTRMPPIPDKVSSEKLQPGRSESEGITRPNSLVSAPAQPNTDKTIAPDAPTEVSTEPDAITRQNQTSRPLPEPQAASAASGKPLSPEAVEVAPKPEASEPPTTLSKTALVTHNPAEPSVSRALPESLIAELARREAPTTLPKVVSDAPVLIQRSPPTTTDGIIADQTRSDSPKAVADTKPPGSSLPVEATTKTSNSPVLVDGVEYQPAQQSGKPQVAGTPGERPGAIQSTKEPQPSGREVVQKDQLSAPTRIDASKPFAAESSITSEDQATPRAQSVEIEEPRTPAGPQNQPAVQKPTVATTQEHTSINTMQTGEAKVSDAEPRQQVSSLSFADAPEVERSPTLETPKPVAHTANTQRADVARSVATQMMAAVGQANDGTIDVRLSPEELGRVRLALVPAELGMTVTITAERPETLDLVRRHIDLFAQDLRQSGFQNLSFSFGQNSRDQQAGFEMPDHVSSEATDASPITPPTPTRSQSSTARLDIRL